jgi:hypothetical protein
MLLLVVSAADMVKPPPRPSTYSPECPQAAEEACDAVVEAQVREAEGEATQVLSNQAALLSLTG